MGIAEQIALIIILCIGGGCVVGAAYFFISVYRILPELQEICDAPVIPNPPQRRATVTTFEVPFFSGADRLTRDGPPRTADFHFWTLVGRKSSDGSVAIEVPYALLRHMGDGPFKIFLAAARLGAKISWTEHDDSLPPLVQRFVRLLFDDLQIVGPPWYYDHPGRKLIIVSGITRVSRHIRSSHERRQEHLAILAGLCHPYTSPVDDRMMDAEWRRRNGFLVSDMTV